MTSDQNKSAQPAAEWTRREMKGIPATLGALWTQRDAEGNWQYAVQLNEDHANAQGFIHGGVLVTFLDHALSLIVWEAAERAMCSTVHLDTHYLKALRPPAFITLQADIMQKGKSLIFAKGRIYHEEKLVVEATGIWRVMRS